MRRLGLLISTLVAAMIVVAGCADGPTERLGGDPPAIPDAAQTPPMGWNSWNTFGCSISEDLIKKQADALVASGLRDVGYRYVVVDDCWAAPQRAADGSLQADPQRFASGMRALGDYLHDRGLLIGIYSGASDKTCTQYLGTYPGATGSRGHESRDAQTFASWGVDFLKYDWCSSQSDHDAQVDSFIAMRDALRDTGRHIVYSINPNSGYADGVPGAEYDWGGVATMTRSTNDIAAQWQTGSGATGSQGITEIIDAMGPLGSRVERGAFNDPDMLVVGVGSSLTPAEERTQMSLWSMMAAPLMLGNDLTVMDDATREILGNRSIIAIDQDERVSAGAPVDDNPDIWARAIGEKGLAVSLTNRSDAPRELTVDLASLGLVGDDSVAGVNAWTGERHQASGGALRVTVAAHDTAVLEIV